MTYSLSWHLALAKPDNIRCIFPTVFQFFHTEDPDHKKPWLSAAHLARDHLTSACTAHEHRLHPCSTAAATPALLACEVVVGPGAQALGTTSPAPWSGSSSPFLSPLLLFLFSFPCAGRSPASTRTAVHLAYASPCNEMQS